MQHPLEEMLRHMRCGIIEAMGIKARSSGLDQTWQLRPGHEAWGLALGYRAELRRAGRMAAPCAALELGDGSWCLAPVRLSLTTGENAGLHELLITLEDASPGAATALRAMLERDRPDGMTTPGEVAETLARMAEPAGVPRTLRVSPGPRFTAIYGPERAREAAALLLAEAAGTPGLRITLPEASPAAQAAT